MIMSIQMDKPMVKTSKWNGAQQGKGRKNWNNISVEHSPKHLSLVKDMDIKDISVWGY